MKAPSPLLGFNNNFKHKGVVFHIQTEDSGVKHPHIITHLFADGGRILKSVKTSYASVLGEENYAEIVRAMMKDQHKAMIVALREGQFEPGGAREVKLPEHGAFTTVAVMLPGTRGTNATEAQRLVVPEDVAPDTVQMSRPPAPRGRSIESIDLEELEKTATVAARRAGEAAAARPPSMRPPSMRPPSMRPPARPSKPPPGVASVPPAKASRPPAPKYAATRPASIFATSKPAAGGSLFGDDLINERSLDEVILGYLAEDLDAEAK